MKELIYFIAFHFEKKRKGDSYNYNKHVVKYEVDFFFFHTFDFSRHLACKSRGIKSSLSLPLFPFPLFYRRFEHH